MAIPAAVTAIYPERKEPSDRWLDRAAKAAAGLFVSRSRFRPLSFKAFLRRVHEEGRALEREGDEALRRTAEDLSIALRREGFKDPLVARSFALVREAAHRTVGMRHFDVQLVGGRVLLKGMVAEMETGEGKTLTATLAACTAALAGIPVHIVTVNDYLASRDGRWMGPIYETLGLTVGTIVHGMTPAQRRAAYACDVTYCTNKEVAFDYLKDRLVLKDKRSPLRLQVERLFGGRARVDRLLLKGLRFAIVDEADSVLVDEARTPLIISGPGRAAEERAVYEKALALSENLVKGRDYTLSLRERILELTERGKDRLADLAEPLGGIWSGTRRREELVQKALQARHLYLRDKDYLVQDGKVQIVDEYTGRLMADRSWERGLHQFIEVKEGCEITGVRETLARISYQRFFRRYLTLSGMTGTAREVARELWGVYGLRVFTVPTNRPLRRTILPDRLFPTEARKWEQVVSDVLEVHRQGRPVLIGTRSVAASEHVSRLLSDKGLEHRVLNARQDQEEAEIIAQAGEPGRITVATNMAGRGTDIRLGPGVADKGGLFVIATERHEAGRIDRQLFGRCGRQGDPGSCRAYVSMQDELLAANTHPATRKTAGLLLRAPGGLFTWVGRLVTRRAQKRAERLHARMRRDLLKMDERLSTALAFSGRPE